MANSKYPHGTICWNELMTRDTDKAARFYSELIGWKADVTDMSEIPYTIFKAGEKQAAGMMNMPRNVPPEVPAHWMAYIAVDDVDELAAKVNKPWIAFRPKARSRQARRPGIPRCRRARSTAGWSTPRASWAFTWSATEG